MTKEKKISSDRENWTESEAKIWIYTRKWRQNYRVVVPKQLKHLSNIALPFTVMFNTNVPFNVSYKLTENDLLPVEIYHAITGFHKSV